MNRADRLYAIVEELRAHSPRAVRAPKLADRFEVSTRTVERDLLALQEAGVPIYAETGRRGGRSR
jgi:predicted DNA-binding transcriptional regulator YafY